MLKPKELPPFLSQVCMGGVQYALLLRTDGIILASSSDRVEGSKFEDEKLIGAICSGMWLTFADESGLALAKKESQERDSNVQDEELQCMIVECETGRLCAAPVGKLLICLKSDLSVEVGLLSKKTKVLAETFRGAVGDIIQ